MTGGASARSSPSLPPDRRRAQDAAGGRGGRRHDRHVRHAHRRRAAGRRVAAVRVEAAQPGPGGRGLRRGRRCCGLLLLDAGPSSRSLPSTRSRWPWQASACRGWSGLFAGVLRPGPDAGRLRHGRPFHHLPIHWMWWPALGGLVVGVGGYFQPHALGVGKDVKSSNCCREIMCRRGAARLLLGQGRDLGHVAGLGHVGRRAGAVADHRRRAGRCRGPLLAGRRRARCGRWSAWPP